MSIINQMLQDLASRNVKPNESGTVGSENIEVPKLNLSWREKFSKGKIEKWILILLLIIFFGAIFKLFFSYKKSVPAAPVITRPVATPPIVTKIELNNLSFKKEGPLTTATFLFNEKVTYRLEQNSEKNTVTLFFDNTKYTSAPPATLPDSAVENIQITNTDTETVVTFILKKGATVLGLIPQENDNKNFIVNFQENEPAEDMGEIKKTIEPLDNRQLAEKSYNQALQALSDDNIKEAMLNLQQSLSYQVDYLPAQQALVTILLQQKNYALAEKYLDQALNQRPNNIELLQLKARTELMQNNPSAALHTLQSFSPPLAENIDYYALIAGIHQQLGDFSLAEQLYRQIVMVQPNEGKWWAGLGVALESEKNSNAAQEAFQRAAALHTLDPNLQAFVDSKINVSNNE